MVVIRPAIAAVVVALATATAPVGASSPGDPVRQAYESVERAAYDALIRADSATGGVIDVDPPPPPPPTVITLDYWTDNIAIADFGAGAYVVKKGVFNQPALWNCALTANAGQPVRVTCTAVPTSGYTWQCGVMHVSAQAYSRPIDGFNWAEEWVTSAQSRSHRVPDAPDPRRLRWGRVAGVASCNGNSVMTAQANQQTPYREAVATLGPVSTFVCEARLSPSSATAPENPYIVNCVDPPAPPQS